MKVLAAFAVANRELLQHTNDTKNSLSCNNFEGVVNRHEVSSPFDASTVGETSN